MVAQSKAWVYCRSLDGIAGSNPTGAWMSATCECCVCCQEEVSAIGQSLVQMSTTSGGVSQCGLETSTTKRPKLNMAVQP